MALHPLQERYLERFFPGLVKELAALGSGEFESTLPTLYQMGNGIRGARLHVTRKLDSGHEISIMVYLRLKDGEAPFSPAGKDDLTPVDLAKWDRPTYSLKLLSLENGRIFAVDLHDDGHGHHVHIPPNTREHVSAGDVIPNTTNMPPAEFVRAVGAYLTDKRCPIRKKT